MPPRPFWRPYLTRGRVYNDMALARYLSYGQGAWRGTHRQEGDTTQARSALHAVGAGAAVGGAARAALRPESRGARAGGGPAEWLIQCRTRRALLLGGSAAVKPCPCGPSRPRSPAPSRRLPLAPPPPRRLGAACRRGAGCRPACTASPPATQHCLLGPLGLCESGSINA